MLSKYPDVMTVDQLADALGISRNSAYRLVNQKAIGCVRVGRKKLIPKVCVIDYLESARYTVKL